jgi:GT2 family glycosyltransferase
MPEPDNRLAVVVITHNRRDEVLRSLGHLSALPERPPITVVDNGSTDGTAEAVAASFPRVEVLRPGRNLGAAGRNLGVRHARAPYVALCDDDTWWEPGSLRLAADLLDAHPGLAVLTGRVLVGPEEVEDPVCAELAASPLPKAPELPGHALLGFLAGASVVRRDAFLSAGGFNERLLIGGEEEWLATDLAAAGHALCYVPDLVVHHYPSERRDPAARRRHLIRNALWFAWLRRPLPAALRRTLWTARSGPRDRVWLAGFAAALAGLPRLLGERRLVPPNVESGLRLLDPWRRPRSKHAPPGRSAPGRR